MQTDLIGPRVAKAQLLTNILSRRQPKQRGGVSDLQKFQEVIVAGQNVGSAGLEGSIGQQRLFVAPGGLVFASWRQPDPVVVPVQ